MRIREVLVMLGTALERAENESFRNLGRVTKRVHLWFKGLNPDKRERLIILGYALVSTGLVFGLWALGDWLGGAVSVMLD